MKFILLAILLIVAVSSSVDGSPPRPGRIVGGVEASMKEIPHQVSLQIYNKKTGKYRHFCGGSITAGDTIVTAAHCLIGEKAEELFVRAGSESKTEGGQLVQAKSFTLHPGYKKNLNYHDVAVMKLKTKLNFDEKVQPIALTPKGTTFNDGDLMLVSGWGHLNYQGTGPELVRKVLVPYVPNDVCAKKYSYITAGSICAGIVGKDACQGDSGGPLVYGNELAGVVSAGYQCAVAGYPGTYARVSEYLDFIKEASA